MKGAGDGLKRPWWDRLADLRARGIPGDHTLASDVFDVAGWFIARHAKDAERHGFQPAHLLSSRGLARMWASALFCPEVVRWEPRVIVYPCMSSWWRVRLRGWERAADRWGGVGGG